MGGATATFWLALLIVSVAMVVALVTTANPPDLPRIVLAIEPAFWFAFFLGGGPHGDLAGEWWYIVPFTFVVALAMWWAGLEGCRRLWSGLRRLVKS